MLSKFCSSIVQRLNQDELHVTYWTKPHVHQVSPSRAVQQSMRTPLPRLCWGKTHHQILGRRCRGSQRQRLHKGSVPVVAAHQSEPTLAGGSLRVLPHQLYFQRGPSKEDQEGRDQRCQSEMVHSFSCLSVHDKGQKKYMNQQDEALALMSTWTARWREAGAHPLGCRERRGASTLTYNWEVIEKTSPSTKSSFSKERQWTDYRHWMPTLLCLKQNNNNNKWWQTILCRDQEQILFCVFPPSGGWHIWSLIQREGWALSSERPQANC